MSRRPGRGRPTAWLISTAWLLALLAGCRADIGASAPVPAAPTLAPTVALPPLPPVTATFPPAVSVPTALPNRATATSPTSAVGPTTSPPAATSSADRLTLSPRPAPPTAAPHDQLKVQEYPVPHGSHPHDVAPAPDGTVWYTAQATGELGRLDPKTGQTRPIKLGAGSAPHGVIVGPDGAPWITDGGLNAIVRVDPQTEAVKVYPLPSGSANANLNTATFDKQGVLWCKAFILTLVSFVSMMSWRSRQWRE